jgi:hypothetical protein
MNDNYRTAIIEGSKSLTPGMSEGIEQALEAQRLAIKQANAKEEINRKAKLKTEVAVQEQIAGIVIPKESAYGEVDVANQMKGLIATHTADRVAIEQGTATEEQVKRSIAYGNYFKNMGQTFGTMSYVIDEFLDIKNTKGTDGKSEGSIDLSSVDPRFNELLSIQDPNSTAEGKVSIDVSYNDGKVQTYQVVKSENIRKINRELYESETNPELKKKYLDESGEISDTFKLSYDEIQSFVDNKNGNIYFTGNQFGTVPGVSPVKDYAIKNEIIGKDGSPKAGYMSQIPFQKTITQDGRRVVVDVTRPEVNKIAGALKSESNTLTRLMFGGGENSAYASFVKANFDKFKGGTIDKDGSIMVPLLKRNEAGDYELDENGNYIPEDSPTEIGSSSLSGGRFNMRTGVGNENLGMTKEDFDKANRFTQDVAMMNLNLNGASKEKINTTATNAINKPLETAKERKLNITERKALNTEKVIVNAIDEMPTIFTSKDLTSSTEADILDIINKDADEAVPLFNEAYPDFEFEDASEDMVGDYINIKSKYNNKTLKKLRIDQFDEGDKESYKTMTEWMSKNLEPIGELGLKQQLESVLPNTSVVRIEDGLLKLKTPKVKAITTTNDGEKVIDYDFQLLEDKEFNLDDKESIKAYLRNRLIGFDIGYLKGTGSKVTTINESGGNAR